MIRQLKRLPMAAIRGLRFCLPAAVVLFLYLLLVNNFFGNVKVTLNADAVGYYDYLPSIFIRHDINRHGKLMAEAPELYHGVRDYPDYHGMKLSKYGCGTALLEAPFFAYALATTPLEGNDQDGFQEPFQKQIFHAALFYLFLTLLLLRKILEGYEVRPVWIFLMQLLLGLGTSVTHYANADAGFSHVYSLFAVTAFIYFARSYFRRLQARHLVGMLASLAVVLLLRQLNGLVVLLLPFLAGSPTALKAGLASMLSDFKGLMVGTVLFLAIFSIQLLLNYFQVGKLFAYSYGEEGFNFGSPHFLDILFSYKKGLFVYTPVLLLAFFGIVRWMGQRQYFLALTWLGFFGLLTYILSSWWAWHFACSYGLRAYIDYYVIFLIPLAVLLDRWQSPAKLLIVVFGLLSIPLNVVQTYQYENFILHWDEMNKDRYWDVFLRTDDKYRGIAYKAEIDTSQYHVIRHLDFGNVTGKPKTEIRLVELKDDSLLDLSQVAALSVKLHSDFKRESDTRMVLRFASADGAEMYHWSDRPLIHYHDKGFGKWHDGGCSYLFPALAPLPPKQLTLFILTGNFASEMQDLSVELWGRKP